MPRRYRAVSINYCILVFALTKSAGFLSPGRVMCMQQAVCFGLSGLLLCLKSDSK